MRRLIAGIMGAIVGGALMFGAFQYHLVRTSDGLILVPKPQATLVDAYADVRNWRAADWKSHPGLVEALIADGRGEVVGTAVSESLFRDMVRRLTGRRSKDSNE